MSAFRVGRARVGIRAGSYVFRPTVHSHHPAALFSSITRHLTTQSETKSTTDLPWEGSLKPEHVTVSTSSTNSTVDLEKAMRDALQQPKAFDDKTILLSKLWSVDQAELQKSNSLWTSAFELGFQQSKAHHKDDLKTVIRVFEKTFDVSQVQDKELLELLVKSYGILNKDLNALRSRLSPAMAEALSERFILSYIECRQTANADALLESISNPSPEFWIKLARVYARNGNISRVNTYLDRCGQPRLDNDILHIELSTYRNVLRNLAREAMTVDGFAGFPRRCHNPKLLESVLTAWDGLVARMREANQTPDLAQCNIMMQMLVEANRVSPTRFPIEKAETFLHESMPSYGVHPDDITYNTLLQGYATCQQFNDTNHNVRLDRAIALVGEMQHRADLDSNTPEIYTALFRACIPHAPNYYPYDYFYLGSAVRLGPGLKDVHLDKRFYALERTMLQVAKLPYNMSSFQAVVVCLGAGGKYHDLRKRWRLLKLSGLYRDARLYQHMFALASLDKEASEYAISVTRNEMARDVAPWDITRHTLASILDCCITAGSIPEAREVIKRMEVLGEEKRLLHKPIFYIPILQACSAIPELAGRFDQAWKQLEENDIVPTPEMWSYRFSRAAIDKKSDASTIQHLFNQYTMSRLQNEGRIPIPVRESSPAVPFPSGPYSAKDNEIIDMYISSLIDAQNLTLAVDVFKTWMAQTKSLGISRRTVQQLTYLAQQESSTDELKWIVDQVLPRVKQQNSKFRNWVEGKRRITGLSKEQEEQSA